MSSIKPSWRSRIKSWQIKINADNWMNYWGWRFAGVLVVSAALLFVVAAVIAGAIDSPECLLLMAICLVLLGQFCLALQNYGARVMRTIIAEEEKQQKSL